MELPLIVGVDGSAASLRALDWAVDEAVRRGAPLRVVYASSWEWYEGHEPSFGVDDGSVRAAAERGAAEAVARARERTHAVEVTGEALPEDPAAALVRESDAACAVVVGSRGRGRLAGLLLGSVSLSVAAHARSPVVVVRDTDGHPATDPVKEVTVGVGEPGESAAAVAFACAAAERSGAALRAVRTWRCPAHETPGRPRPAAPPDPHQRLAQEALDEALREPLRSHRSLVVRREVLEGDARTALLDASRTSGLLVVGARRRKGHLGMQLGPVSHALLHHAACPVAVVPHG
ncbi:MULTISPECIES: universal stress protein [Streptomyces]|uniref:universal stress protein n=1 Tax=Streptomyces TaxID=1883 RepID=UPI0006EB90F7|nr:MULTISPECIES: universal stress protein [Streptomyces]